jgi:hypothetical protein
LPISRIFFSGKTNRDRHVLRGQTSPDLSATAVAFIPTVGPIAFAAPYMAAHPGDATLAFKPLFKGVVNGDLYEGFGIHVNTKTGTVRVDAGAPPAPTKNNFMLEVTATNTVDGATFTDVIRIHVHTSVRRIWLTPGRLTVRPSGAPLPEHTKYRFSVRAEFDDDTVGDVTLNHGVTWSPASNADANGQLSLAAGNNPGTDVVVTATLPTPAGPQTANATLHVGQPWSSEPNVPKASIVPGGGWPGTIKPEKVPNVLFLGDGFRAEDQVAFERITTSFVQHIKLDRITRPFDLLATSMNFWRTFVPAPAKGISVRSEVYTFDAGPQKYAAPLPAAKKPIGADPWDMYNLVYMVGLPVKADGNAAKDMRAEWAATVDVDPAPHLTDDLISQWKSVANRAFLDEIDAFPGMSYGDPPAANADAGYMLNLHEERGGVDALKPLYRRLASDSGVALDGSRPIGVVWADTDPSFYFDNTDLVALVSSLPAGRALNGTGYIAISTQSANAGLPVTPVAGRLAFTLDSVPIPPDISADSGRTMIHELAHSFGLGDEYADFRARFPSQDDPLPDFGNLSTEKNVKSAAGHFDGDEVKWNWRRIRKAALIESAITEAGGTFTIPLHPGHGFQFANGDKVLLRVRARGKALLKKPDELASNQELQVSSPAADSIDVRPVTPGSVTLAQLARFVPGSIVYIATPAPDSVKSAAYPYAEMIGLNVKTAITTGDRPLTAVPCANTLGPDVQAPDLTGINLPGVCFKHKPRIVGLYEGGSLHTCGIFHPTGTCMMRQDHDEHAEFCAACRYIVIDFVQPFFHFEIDRDYAEIYPQG